MPKTGDTIKFKDCKAGDVIYGGGAIWNLVPSGEVMPSFAPDKPVMQCVASLDKKYPIGQIQIDYFNHDFMFICNGEKNLKEALKSFLELKDIEYILKKYSKNSKGVQRTQKPKEIFEYESLYFASSEIGKPGEDLLKKINKEVEELLDEHLEALSKERE